MKQSFYIELKLKGCFENVSTGSNFEMSFKFKLFLIFLCLICCSPVFAKDEPPACAVALMPYVGLFLKSDNSELQQAVSVLLEQSEEIGELLLDLNQHPSKNRLLNNHIDKIYKLNPQSAFILTAAVLNASLKDVNKEMIRDTWDEFISSSKASEEVQRAINQTFKRQEINNKNTPHNPYIDSLALRDLFLLLKDPNYQSILVLKDKNENISGYVSYKSGDSKILDYVQLNNAYIFFETYKRVYVFQVQPQNNLSTNVLVFNKKKSDFITNNIYYEYFEELQSYFKSQPEEIDEELVDNILDNLDMITTTKKTSNFLDRLIYRLTKIQDTFNIPPFSIIDNALTRYNATKNDFRILTLLKIAHYLGVDLSILLSDTDLIPHVHIDLSRPPLSDEYIFEVERKIKTELRDVIRESELTLSDLADQSAVPIPSLRSIIAGRAVPKYLVMKNITNVLGLDINEFLIQIVNDVSRDIPPYQLDNNPDQNRAAILERIGNRIKQAVFLAGFDSKAKLRKVLKIQIDELGKYNPQLKILLRASYTTGIKLAVLVGDTSLEDQVDPRLARHTEMPEDYFRKAKSLIIYYIKKRMVELNFSIKDVASLDSELKEKTMRALLNGNRTPGYLLLSQIAKTLNTTLPDLLQNLEEDIEQFDSLDLNIEVPTSNRNNLTDSVLNELNRWRQRMVQAVELTHISPSRLNREFNIKLSTLREGNFQLVTLFTMAHLAGITVSELLGHKDLSKLIDPHRDIKAIKPLSDSQIKRKTYRFSQNITKQMENVYGYPLPLHIRNHISIVYTSPFVPSSRIIQTSEELNIAPVYFFAGL